MRDVDELDCGRARTIKERLLLGGWKDDDAPDGAGAAVELVDQRLVDLQAVHHHRVRLVHLPKVVVEADHCPIGVVAERDDKRPVGAGRCDVLSQRSVVVLGLRVRAGEGGQSLSEQEE